VYFNRYATNKMPDHTIAGVSSPPRVANVVLDRNDDRHQATQKDTVEAIAV
jgi:hypothetical protein